MPPEVRWHVGSFTVDWGALKEPGGPVHSLGRRKVYLDSGQHPKEEKEKRKIVTPSLCQDLESWADTCGGSEECARGQELWEGEHVFG